MRFGVFAMFGVGAGFMVVTNLMAFSVLRPSKDKLGFLWWHVTAISLSFACIGLVAVEQVASKVGNPFGWRTLLVFVGMLLYVVAQVIIFSVERRRLISARAHRVAAAASPPGNYEES